MFSHVFRSLKRSLVKYGIFGTLARGCDFLYWQAWRFTPEGRQAHRRRSRVSQDFDATHNVDTGGIVHLSQFQIADASWIHGNYYEAIHPDLFRDVIEAACLGDPSRYLFLDFGAGKGRAMFLASNYPFRKIIGIEFSPELVATAHANLTSFQNPTQRCRDLEMVLLDATKYPLPLEPAVLYFYNPFQAPLMTLMIDLIESSLRQQPREIVVLYVNPEHDHLWRRAPALIPTHQSRLFSVYKTMESTVP